MERACDVCSKPYNAQRPSSKFCGAACRQRSARGASQVEFVPDAPTDPSEPSGLVQAVEAELTEAGRLATRGGQQAISLAKRIDSPHETGSAVSALSKELRAVMDEAMKGAHAKADPVDELRRLREQKRSAG